MADKFSARVTGLQGSRRKLRALVAAVKIENRDEMAVQVKNVEREAKRIVPRKDATLIRTINSEVEISIRKGVIGLVGANTKYAERLEDPDNDLRHRSRKGFVGRRTPYLMPALTRNFRKISQGVANATKRAVRRTA